MDNLDDMTHITISRFFRDKQQWKKLEKELIPDLLEDMKDKDRPFRVWSAGSASGEEPYSFAVLWEHGVEASVDVEIIATEIDDDMLERTDKARYNKSSLKEMPNSWIEKAFEEEDGEYRLKDDYKQMVNVKRQDIREEMPEGPFDIVFCKNLVAMYFDKELATKLFRKIVKQMRGGAVLFLGNHEEIAIEEEPDKKQPVHY